MKFLIAFVALAAVAVATPLKPIDTFEAELSAIIAAINHPSTDPATATLLQEQLENIMAQLNPEPISVGPAIVDPNEYEPISVGPAIIEPTPVVVAPAPSGNPLVQVIINVAGASAEVADVPQPRPTPSLPTDVHEMLPPGVLPDYLN